VRDNAPGPQPAGPQPMAPQVVRLDREVIHKTTWEVWRTASYSFPSLGPEIADVRFMVGPQSGGLESFAPYSNRGAPLLAPGRWASRPGSWGRAPSP